MLPPIFKNYNKVVTNEISHNHYITIQTDVNHVYSFIRFSVIYCMIIRYITVIIDWLF